MQQFIRRLVGPATPPSHGRVATAWVLTRIFAVACIWLTPRLLDDVDIYRGWLPYLHWGQFPVSDAKWQYPPGAAAALLAPEGLHLNYSVAFAVTCLIVDAAVMTALILAHARRPAESRAGLWLWAVAAVVVGPIMYTRFDIVPAAFAVGVVLLATRPALAGASAALGFVVKVWPVALLLALPRPSTRRAAVAFVATTAVSLALMSLRFSDSLSFLGNQRARGLQVESTGALPYELWTLVGGRMHSGLEYGSYQVLMAGAQLLGTVLTLTGLALLALIAWWRLRGRLESVSPGDVAVTVVLVTVATSRVYSPQYNTWIIAVLAAALLSRRTRLRRVAVILAGVSLITQLVYPWFPYDLMDGNPPIVAVQCLRIIGLVVATVLAFRAIWPSNHAAIAPVAVVSDGDAQEESWTYYQDSRSPSASR